MVKPVPRPMEKKDEVSSTKDGTTGIFPYRSSYEGRAIKRTHSPADANVVFMNHDFAKSIRRDVGRV